jgi:heptosyltransferase-2
MPKPRILAIRGGAIGDFILTLPALRLLRENFAQCHLEILGYQHIASLARHGGAVAGQTYADEVRNIEAAPLAGFFARNGNLSTDWCEYFASFNQIVSWLFDPDGIFEANVHRAGVTHYLSAYAKISDEAHASAQLARGLERMALFLDETIAPLIPGAATRQRATEWLNQQPGRGERPSPLTALHPGSGSSKKNWPLENWRTLAQRLRDRGQQLLLLGGEADGAALDALASLTPLVARSLPLPTVAGLFAQCSAFYGHDTGLSHLAAAVGVPSTLLFGPTDPAVWAPQGPHVRILRATDGDLAALSVDEVLARV